MGKFATIVISEDEAVLWTESRYIELAEKQLDKTVWQIMELGKSPTIEEWLVKLPKDSKIGIDPFLIEAKKFHALNEYLSNVGNGHTLERVQKNLVDVVWGSRPIFVSEELEPIDINSSGNFAYCLVQFVFIGNCHSNKTGFIKSHTISMIEVHLLDDNTMAKCI